MKLISLFSAGEYSCLSVDLVFKRQFSYYLITIYVPGCMLVIVSWVNFWLDPKVGHQYIIPSLAWFYRPCLPGWPWG